MAAQPQILLSEEEYLTMERTASFKSEFFKGQVYAMSGGSIAHNDISGNIYALFHAYLKGKNCRPYNSDQRIKVPSWPSYLYPDVSVVCGELVIVDKDNITNPVIIVEVLSSSTEGYDRTTKFGQYREIETLREYFLVSSKKKEVTRFWRDDDSNCWTESFYSQSHPIVNIESIKFKMSLDDIYEHVKFDPYLNIL